MEQLAVQAVTRKETGKRAARKLRQTGNLPAVMYNAKGEAVSLAVNESAFNKVWRQTTPTTLVNLSVDGKDVGTAFIKATEYNILTDSNLHVDFQVIDTKKPLKLTMKVQFSGTPTGVREGGRMITHIPQIDVQCLPKDLPPRIITDISALGIGSVLKVKDLQLGAGVTVITDSEAPLISVAAND